MRGGGMAGSWGEEADPCGYRLLCIMETPWTAALFCEKHLVAQGQMARTTHGKETRKTHRMVR